MDKVKRPSSAYLFFCNKVRSEVKAENPDKKPTEVTKIIGEKWKSLSTEEKTPFVEQAKVDKERYTKEKGSATATEAPKKPKKPPTAYMLFANSVRAAIRGQKPGISLGEISQKTSEMWKALRDEEKEDFIIEAEKLKKDSAASPPAEAAATATSQAKNKKSK